MATSISSIGVGSGLPLDTLLADLRKAENVPLAALQSRAEKEQQRFSAYGTLKSALDTVSSAAATLGKAATFNAVKPTVTGETFTASAKAGSGAIPGSYSVKVGQLATAQVLSTDGVAMRNENLASGSGKVDITFTIGEGDAAKTHTVQVDAGKSSLEDIVKAINADSKLGVSATLMNDGSADPHRLMISADNTGTASRITSISVEAGEGATAEDVSQLKSILGYQETPAPAEGEEGGTEGEGGPEGEGDPGDPVVPAGMKQMTAAKDAQLTINGVAVTAQSNTIENAIEGITLTLAKESAENAPADTLKVTRDDSVATSAVTGFVNAYNALQSTIKALTSYDIDSQKGAALTGDSLPRRAQAEVREAFSGLAANGITLTTLGIKTDPVTGNLSVDNEKLAAALKDNRAEVEQIFSGAEGLSKRVTKAVETFTKSDGLIKTSQDSITETLKRLEKQYEQMEMRIEDKMENYRKQFVQLDAFMAQQNSISSYLTSQLSMLENLSSGNSKK